MTFASIVALISAIGEAAPQIPGLISSFEAIEAAIKGGPLTDSQQTALLEMMQATRAAVDAYKPLPPQTA